MKYGWRLADIDTSDYAKVMSDKEMHARDDLKMFCGVFVKECFASEKMNTKPTFKKDNTLFVTGIKTYFQLI